MGYATENDTRKTGERTLRASTLKSAILSDKVLEKTYTYKHARKVLHISFSSFGFALVLMPSYHLTILLTLYTLTVITLLLDTLRLVSNKMMLMFHKHFNTLLIPRDLQRYSSASFYLLGCSTAALIFEPRIAGMGIIFLGIGDALASIGGLYGKKIIPLKLPYSHKTWIGFVCFVLSSTVAGLLLGFHLQNLLIAGVVCALCEVYITFIDDNFLIPIVGAGVLALLG